MLQLTYWMILMRNSKMRKIFRCQTDKEIDDLSKDSKLQEAKTIKSSGTWCSLLKSFCKPMNCETCSSLNDEHPQKQWLCSVCSEDKEYILHPYWGDTRCTKCGWEYGVMVLAKKRKKRKR